MGKGQTAAKARKAVADRQLEQMEAAEKRRVGPLVGVLEHELMTLGVTVPHDVAHTVVRLTTDYLGRHSQERMQLGLAGELAQAEHTVALALTAQDTHCAWGSRCAAGCPCTYCIEARTMP
jgi:hypothetical protein